MGLFRRLAIVIALAIWPVSSSVAAPTTSITRLVTLGRSAIAGNRHAAHELRILARTGNPDAETILGNLYLNGQGVSQNYVKADYWYKKAAAQGDAIAETTLGHIYDLSGVWVKANYIKAVYWFRKAAAQGNAEAEFRLGSNYLAGLGVKTNDTKAAAWWRKAAAQGYSTAEYYLGALYLTGKGVSQNNKKAAFWYRKAAEQGNRHAELDLGIRYLSGQGVPQDYTSALKWLILAKGGGSKSAAKDIRAVERIATAAQVVRAHTLANQWRKTHHDRHRIERAPLEK